jgi:uncharacterized protein YqeY
MNADASSDSALKERIQDDIKAAMRAREKEHLGVLRLIGSEIKQREVDERITLDDAAIVAVLDKMVKQRKDSLEQYQKAGRDDLANQESYELTIIEPYLPARVSAEELAQILDQAFADVAPSSMKDMGKLMDMVKPQLQGRADMGAVSKQVRERLTSL